MPLYCCHCGSMWNSNNFTINTKPPQPLNSHIKKLMKIDRREPWKLNNRQKKKLRKYFDSTSKIVCIFVLSLFLCIGHIAFDSPYFKIYVFVCVKRKEKESLIYFSINTLLYVYLFYVYHSIFLQSKKRSCNKIYLKNLVLH